MTRFAAATTSGPTPSPGVATSRQALRGTERGQRRLVLLGRPELVRGHHVRLEGRLDDVRRQAVAGDDDRVGARVRRTAAPQEDAALGVLALGHRLDLVLDERRLPAQDGPDRLVDRAIERVDRAVPGRLTGALVAVERQPNAPGGPPTVRGGHAPALHDDGCRDVTGALLEERQEIGVGDLLLDIGQRDRLAVDDVERVAGHVVPEIAELLLEALAP
jgi:hypothetical protein